jgi:8-oxo-dGTP pyrophosphatase MutT (NUDIX family)
MNKKNILNQLTSYQTNYAEEVIFQEKIIRFLENNDDFYQRSNLAGHLTGSAWVLSPDKKSALLIHHKKLNKWLQPGGHADDGDESLSQTAEREAIEECGLSEISLLNSGVFDVDVHEIPQKGTVPAHFHYDIRFLFQTQTWDFNPDFSEVKAIKWVKLEDLLQDKVLEQSIKRMVLKTIT